MAALLVLLLAAGVVAAFLFRPAGPPAQAVIVADRDLPAYSAVGDGDLSIAIRRLEAGQTAASLPVERRILLRAVRRGEPLLAGDVGPASYNMVGPAPMSVALRTRSVPQSAAPASLVTIFLPRGDRRGKAGLRAILVAGPERVGSAWRVTVSLPRSDVQKYLAQLVSGDIVIGVPSGG